MLFPPSTRPAFTTLQQHYSPRKTTAPKPPSSALINATPAPESSPATPAALEAIYQQTHLLHLSLLHSSFHTTFPAYCASARRSLANKFASASGLASAVREAEREAALRSNVAALSEWGGGPDSGGGGGGGGGGGALGEHVAALAGVVQESATLLDSPGRVSAWTDSFGEWISCVAELWAAREDAGGAAGASAAATEFIDGLGDEWRAEGVTLVRRVRGLASVLDGLERPREGTAVAKVLGETAEALALAADEVETCLAVEKVVVRMEGEWVDGLLGALWDGGGGGGGGQQNRHHYDGVDESLNA
jgi:hypothetical protein